MMILEIFNVRHIQCLTENNRKKMKNEKLFWKQIFEKTFFGFGHEKTFFGFSHEKTALARKITPVLDRIPGYKRTALKESACIR